MEIYATIAQVMSEIDAIAKGRKNQQQGFSYRGIDDVMNELHPVMARNGLFVVPEVLHEERSEKTTSRGGILFYTRLTIRFTFYAKDGSNVAATVIGEAMDSGDKASNKALSIGLKYALLQVFCIPTEDDKDPDAQSFEVQASPAHQGQNQQNAKAAQNQKTQNTRAAQNQQNQRMQGPKGGNDTDEERNEINRLLSLRAPNGELIFSQEFCNKLGSLRMTKTAQEVIAMLNEEVTRITAEQIPEDLF